jgi:hypothetical protein
MAAFRSGPRRILAGLPGNGKKDLEKIVQVFAFCRPGGYGRWR